MTQGLDYALTVLAETEHIDLVEYELDEQASAVVVAEGDVRQLGELPDEIKVGSITQHPPFLTFNMQIDA